MPTIKLSRTAIERVKAPTRSGKQELCWDTELKGFAILASGVSSARSFIVQREINGKTRRMTIGPVNVLDLDQARAKAAAIIADMLAGIDPKEQRKKEKALAEAAAAASATAVTLQQALDRYLRDNKALRPGTRVFYKRSIEKHLADWLDRPLASITRDMVRQRHGEIADRISAEEKARERKPGRVVRKGEARANAVLCNLRTIWNGEIERDESFPPNPVRLKRNQRFQVPPRDRVLRAGEYAMFFKALSTAVSNSVARDYILLLMFTGMRKGEAASLRWADIDFVGQVIRVRATQTKTRRALDLPMSDYIRDLLVARRAMADGPFVFPAASRSGHVEEPKHAFREIEEATGIWVSSHDLRRGLVTVSESLPLPPMHAAAIVNHNVGSGVHAGYARLNAEHLRVSMQMITDKLKQLCGIEPPIGAVKLAPRVGAAE